MVLTGRTRIYSNASEINETNVVEELRKAIGLHEANVAQERYLWNYYKGRQPVLERTKEIRPDICARVVENRAAEIVQWKVGYLLNSPMTYVSTNPDDKSAQNISTLNSFMRAEGKSSKDKTLAEYLHVCGVAYRIIFPDSAPMDESPFEMYVPEPWRCFVVYSSKVDEKPLMGVYISYNELGVPVYSVYTDRKYFEVTGANEIIRNEDYPLGIIPVIEYDMGVTRMGAFENVIPLLDAINELQSGRIDGIRQTIEQLCIAYNCEFEQGTTANDIRQAGMIQLKSVGENKADFKILVSNLSQTDSQSLKNDLHDAYLTICGMPNRSGGGSTSDNGIAVIYRDGFTDAEARANNTEDDITIAEMEMLRLILKICNGVNALNGMKLADVECKFTRRLYDNMQTKAQVLTTMLSNEKIAPQLAFESCGLFSSPDDAYRLSMEWYERNKQTEEAVTNDVETENDDGSGEVVDEVG